MVVMHTSRNMRLVGEEREVILSSNLVKGFSSPIVASIPTVGSMTDIIRTHKAQIQH